MEHFHFKAMIMRVTEIDGRSCPPGSKLCVTMDDCWMHTNGLWDTSYAIVSIRYASDLTILVLGDVRIIPERGAPSSAIQLTDCHNVTIIGPGRFVISVDPENPDVDAHAVRATGSCSNIRYEVPTVREEAAREEEQPWSPLDVMRPISCVEKVK